MRGLGVAELSATSRPGAGLRACALVLALTLSLAASACGSSDSDDSRSTGATEQAASTGGENSERPRLLVLHSGGFMLGDRKDVEEAMDRAARAGFKPVYVDYPLGDLPAAVRFTYRQARRQAARGHDVFAYGESAGGTLAALLATRGLVHSAASYSQITDLSLFASRTPDPQMYKDYISATDADLRRFSPNRHEAVAEVLALAPTSDSAYLTRPTLRWAERKPEVRSVSVEGGHLAEGDPDLYTANMRRAIAWLARGAGA